MNSVHSEHGVINEVEYGVGGGGGSQTTTGKKGVFWWGKGWKPLV